MYLYYKLIGRLLLCFYNIFLSLSANPHGLALLRFAPDRDCFVLIYGMTHCESIKDNKK